jgi:hypothetical protein
VLSPADLPLAELCGARLDGEVYANGDGWCPVDEVDDAAWIYGACPEPARQQFCVDAACRVKMILSPRIRLREVALPTDDVVVLPGMRVTTPARTMADIARDEAAGDDEAIAAVRALMARFECTGAILDRLPHSGRQHARATARLRAAADALLAVPGSGRFSRR